MTDTEEKLKECKRLHILIEKRGEGYELEDLDRFKELRDELTAECLPVVRGLAEAGLLTFGFSIAGTEDPVLHFLEFACEKAYVEGNVIIDGRRLEGGSKLAVKAFEKCLEALPKE
tara:strand:+ start:27 stop:374 length:348 start_codon:yes stop_codon:yes gene_type:complete